MKDARDEEDPRLCEPVRQGPFWTVDCHDSAPLRHFRSRRRAQGPDAVAFFCEADSSSSFPRNPLRTRRRAGRWQCAAWKGAFHHGRWRESRRFRPGHRLSEDRLSIDDVLRVAGVDARTRIPERADRLMAELLRMTADSMSAKEATARLEGEPAALRSR